MSLNSIHSIPRRLTGRWLPLLGLAMLWSAGASAQILIASEEFRDDISGWTAAGDPGGQVIWDGTQGSPAPGSLALIAPPSAATEDGFRAVGQCRNVRPLQAYTVLAQVREAPGPRAHSCLPTPVFYDSTDCQGEGSIGGVGDMPSSGSWRSESRSLTSFNSSLSMRVELVMSAEAGDVEAVCNFDSVRLYEGRFVQTIPFLSPTGVLLLVLAVACVAWIRGFRSG